MLKRGQLARKNKSYPITRSHEAFFGARGQSQVSGWRRGQTMVVEELLRRVEREGTNLGSGGLLRGVPG